GYSGMMSVTGEPDGPPAKCGIPVGDFVAGLYAALTIVASLRRRDATGHGAVLDCSMLASLLSISSLQVSQFLGTGAVPEPLGSAHPRNAPYQAYECQDGFITIAAGTHSLWCRFCDVIGHAELRTDRRFVDQASRAENQAELTAVIEPVLRSHPRSWWLDRLLAQGIPCGPVNTFAEVIEDDQVRSMEIISDLVLPNGTKTKAVAFPVRTNSWEVLPSSPPKLGEHTEEVLREWMPRPNKSK
ncbi:MAG: CaiB/BaiF CoA transferase family protein, partial [Streptosporangiaceae bacterium]